MSDHTKESLEALRLKSDVIEIAEGLGLDTEGTRDEIEDRILAHQASSPEETETETTSEVESAVHERARDDEGKFEPDVDDTAPDEAYAPPKPGKFTDKALGVAKLWVASVLGADGADEVEDELKEALAAGKQPCVVEGEGNARYAFKVFDAVLHRHDVSRDVTGVKLNIARKLADKNLYPTSG